MAENRISINGSAIWQPDEGIDYNFETTYTSDTQRVTSGQLKATPLFTVEQLGYSATEIPISEATRILRAVAKGLPFSLFYFSIYYGVWRTDTFRVGKGQCSIGRLNLDDMTLKSLSFNMTGDNPLN